MDFAVSLNKLKTSGKYLAKRQKPYENEVFDYVHQSSNDGLFKFYINTKVSMIILNNFKGINLRCCNRLLRYGNKPIFELGVVINV